MRKKQPKKNSAYDSILELKEKSSKTAKEIRNTER